MKVKLEKIELEQTDDKFITQPLMRNQGDIDMGEPPVVPVLETIKAWEWTNEDFSIFTDDDFSFLIPISERIPNPYWAEADPKAKAIKTDLGKVDLTFTVNVPGEGFIRHVALVSQGRSAEVKARLGEGTKMWDALTNQVRRMYSGTLEE